MVVKGPLPSLIVAWTVNGVHPSGVLFLPVELVVIASVEVLLGVTPVTGFGLKVTVVPAGRMVVMFSVAVGAEPLPFPVKPMV